MSEENKAVVSEKSFSGDRGEVGVATAGLKMRQRWAESGKLIPLKQFARALLKEGDADAKEWFGNKRGAKNQKRSDANIKAAKETSMASKAARQKKK